MSDIVVYNVEQKINMINDFIEVKTKLPNNNKGNFILNIGRFDSFSKYSIKNISRYVGLKSDMISAVPYNTLYFEAASEAEVADLFLRIRKVNENERNGGFVKWVKDAGEKIIYKIKELQMIM